MHIWFVFGFLPLCTGCLLHYKSIHIGMVHPVAVIAQMWLEFCPNLASGDLVLSFIVCSCVKPCITRACGCSICMWRRYTLALYTPYVCHLMQNRGQFDAKMWSICPPNVCSCSFDSILVFLPLCTGCLLHYKSIHTTLAWYTPLWSLLRCGWNSVKI